jgi:hypothetical protein
VTDFDHYRTEQAAQQKREASLWTLSLPQRNNIKSKTTKLTYMVIYSLFNVMITFYSYNNFVLRAGQLLLLLLLLLLIYYWSHFTDEETEAPRSGLYQLTTLSQKPPLCSELW